MQPDISFKTDPGSSKLQVPPQIATLEGLLDYLNTQGFEISNEAKQSGTYNKIYRFEDRNKKHNSVILRTTKFKSRRLDFLQQDLAALNAVIVDENVESFAEDYKRRGVHPFVYIAFIDKNQLVVLMEAYDIDLFDLLSENVNFELFSKSQLMDIPKQIELRLERLHENGLYCVDHKPENVVVKWGRNDKIDVRIIDLDAKFCRKLREWRGPSHSSSNNADDNKKAHVILSLIILAQTYLYPLKANNLTTSTFKHRLSDLLVPMVRKKMQALTPLQRYMIFRIFCDRKLYDYIGPYTVHHYNKLESPFNTSDTPSAYRECARIFSLMERKFISAPLSNCQPFSVINWRSLQYRSKLYVFFNMIMTNIRDVESAKDCALLSYSSKAQAMIPFSGAELFLYTQYPSTYSPPWSKVLLSATSEPFLWKESGTLMKIDNTWKNYAIALRNDNKTRHTIHLRQEEWDLLYPKSTPRVLYAAIKSRTMAKSNKLQAHPAASPSGVILKRLVQICQKNGKNYKVVVPLVLPAQDGHTTHINILVVGSYKGKAWFFRMDPEGFQALKADNGIETALSTLGFPYNYSSTSMMDTKISKWHQQSLENALVELSQSCESMGYISNVNRQESEGAITEGICVMMCAYFVYLLKRNNLKKNIQDLQMCQQVAEDMFTQETDAFIVSFLQFCDSYSLKFENLGIQFPRHPVKEASVRNPS